MRRCLVILIASILTIASPAGAYGTGGGSVDNDHVSVGVTVTFPGIDSPIDLSKGTSTQWLDWAVARETSRQGDLNGLCLPPQTDPAHVVLGVLFHVIGRDRATGAVVYDHWQCVPISAPGQRPGAPQPPQLPTVEEAWRAAHLPRPNILLDPATRGITGLDTRISTEPEGALQIAATVRGYTITGTATPTGYTIQVDDEPATTATNAHFVFETKGVHTIRVGVVWHGTATLTGPDLAQPITTDIGDATVTTTRQYQVNEIRSVLQP
jgi:hypothetical protein